ncbi:MAG: hypothetical protein AABZ10_01030 [Nitrospirota bacterium]
MRNIVQQVVMAGIVIFAATGTGFAGECTDNGWQPTFVRHDSVAPTVYYYTGHSFIPMSTPAEAQRTCETQGVRMTINGDTCAQRPWGHFGCGCNITPSPNTTCAAFQNFLRNTLQKK